MRTKSISSNLHSLTNNSIYALANYWGKNMNQDFYKNSHYLTKKFTHYEKRRFPLEEKFPEIYLTLQETKYVFYSLKGLSNKRIATKMGLSVRTVAFYSGNIRRKLQCKNRSELNEKLEPCFINFRDEIYLLMKDN